LKFSKLSGYVIILLEPNFEFIKKKLNTASVKVIIHNKHIFFYFKIILFIIPTNIDDAARTGRHKTVDLLLFIFVTELFVYKSRSLLY
jgi:hypothetical protein